MNRDREPTQVLDSTSPLPSEEAGGLSKIKATALLLKQKVAGTNTKPQKVPNKISHPWTLNSSSRSNSFPSPNSPNSASTSTSHHGPSTSTASTTVLANNGTLKKDSIKAMIAAREDPSLSCNKMAPQGIQPAPAPQKRDVRAGMTKLQLSPSPQRSTSASTSTPPLPPQSEDSKKKEQLDQGEQLKNNSSIDKPQLEEEQQRKQNIERVVIDDKVPTENSTVELSKRPTRRRNAGGEALLPSQFSTPSSTSSSTPLFMKAFQDPSLIATNTNTTDITSTITTTEATAKINDYKINDNNENNNNNNEATQINHPRMDISASVHSSDKDSTTTSMTSSIPSPTTNNINSSQAKNESKKEKASPTTKTTKTSTPPTSPKASKATTTTTSIFEQRPPSSPRRHTTSSTSSSSSSLFSSQRHATPPLPVLTQQQIQQHEKQPKSHVNPTLRQIQTPNIPVNLVQARILQQEEQKKRDEELAKIPITANLRTVKKVQAVLLDDEEEEKASKGQQGDGTDESGYSSLLSPSIPSGFSSLGPATVARPRAKTTTSSTVTVSTLLGGKQRGDRNHVEPVVIPKKLAEQVEHILGRKLAGKGSVLDEREQEREEEEARKAAEPLPPIVRGQPRKRAMTSAHIRNLVSSWDHKVEEAKEIVSEAEQVRQFLEQRSTAHAELPKFSKVQLSGSELLKPLPSLPPPPPVSSTGKTQRKAVGHSKAASTASPYMSSSHVGSSSLSSPTLSTEAKSSSSSPSERRSSKDTTIVSASLDFTNVAADVVTSPNLVPEIIIDDQKTPKALATNASNNNKPMISLEKLDTKRSGNVLDNKAVINRPRRARKVTLTQAEA